MPTKFKVDDEEFTLDQPAGADFSIDGEDFKLDAAPTTPPVRRNRLGAEILPDFTGDQPKPIPPGVPSGAGEARIGEQAQMAQVQGPRFDFPQGEAQGPPALIPPSVAYTARTRLRNMAKDKSRFTLTPEQMAGAPELAGTTLDPRAAGASETGAVAADALSSTMGQIGRDVMGPAVRGALEPFNVLNQAIGLPPAVGAGKPILPLGQIFDAIKQIPPEVLPPDFVQRLLGGPIQQGAERGVAELAGGLTTPENIGWFTAMKVPNATLHVLTDAGFSVDMIRSLYDQVPQVKQAFDEKNWPLVAQLGVQAAGTGVLAGMTARGAMRGAPAAAAELPQHPFKEAGDAIRQAAGSLQAAADRITGAMTMQGAGADLGPVSGAMGATFDIPGYEAPPTSAEKVGTAELERAADYARRGQSVVERNRQARQPALPGPRGLLGTGELIVQPGDVTRAMPGPPEAEPTNAVAVPFPRGRTEVRGQEPPAPEPAGLESLRLEPPPAPPDTGQTFTVNGEDFTVDRAPGVESPGGRALGRTEPPVAAAGAAEAVPGQAGGLRRGPEAPPAAPPEPPQAPAVPAPAPRVEPAAPPPSGSTERRRTLQGPPAEGERRQPEFTFYSGKNSPSVQELARKRGDVGIVVSPLRPDFVKDIPKYRSVIVDNGAFSKEGFKANLFNALLDNIDKTPGAKERVRFVVAPDVPGAAGETLDQFLTWGPNIRRKGFKVALAAQDGLEFMPERIPWDKFDVLFMGGTTEWKLGSRESKAWDSLLQEATDRGKEIHFGRVNSKKRADFAQFMGATSADGNLLSYGETINQGRLNKMQDSVNRRPDLGPGAEPPFDKVEHPEPAPQPAAKPPKAPPPPRARGPEQSQGHIGFIGDFEFFKGSDGDIYRAKTSDPIQTDGRRFGRFESTPAAWPAVRAQWEKPKATEVGAYHEDTTNPPRAWNRRNNATGNETTARLEDGTTVPMKWAIVQLDSLTQSHNLLGEVNPRFPADLQPRDRSRTSSREQIDKMAKNLASDLLMENPKASEGAPVVGAGDGIVESGNGRVLAIRRAYELGTGENYKKAILSAADRLGIDRADLPNRPVLVRLRENKGMDRTEFARRANESGVARMSSTEQARADAAAMPADVLDSLAPEPVTGPGNREFVRAFLRQVVSESDRRGYTNSEGELNKEGRTRVQNAVMAKAYGGDADALERMIESADENVKNVATGMQRAAATFAKAERGMAQGELHPLSIADDLMAAVKKLSYLREQGQKVTDYLKQEDMFGGDLTPMSRELLRLFDEKSRSANYVHGLLENYAKTVEAAGNPKNVDMFGGPPEAPTREEVLQSADEGVRGEGATGTLFADQAGEAPYGGKTQPTKGETPAKAAGPSGPPRIFSEGGGARSGRQRKAERRRAADAETDRREAESGRREPGPRTTRRGRGEFPDLIEEMAQREAAANDPEPARTGELRGEKKGVVSDLREALESTREKLSAVSRDVHRGLSPGTYNDAARMAGPALRQHLAETALARLRAHKLAAESIKVLDRLSEEDRNAFIHRVETNEAQPTPELQKAHAIARELLDEGRKELQALGRLQSGFYEHYFPHLWKARQEEVETKLSEFYGKRPFEGPKSFLKKRKYPTYAEGLDAGLKPKFDNPMEAMLAHRAMVDRYVAAMKTIKDGLAEGWIKKVYTDYQPPAGWQRLPESFGTIYGDRNLPIRAQVDARQFEQLQNFASSLGIKIKREAKVPPGDPHPSAFGYTYVPGNEVVARFATGMGTLAHEIGHQLDHRFGLWDAMHPKGLMRATKAGVYFGKESAGGKQIESPEGIKRRKAIDDQLRALADLRNEQVEGPVPKGSAYQRSRSEKMAHIVDAYTQHRARMKEIAPDVFAQLETVIQQHPELKPLKDIRPSMNKRWEHDTAEVKGQVIAGRMYAPASVVRLFDNHLAPGLQNKALYQALRSAGNSMTQMQLGFSAFHAGFTTLDAMVSKVALGVERLGRGNLRGFADIAEGITPLGVFNNLRRGNRVMREAMSGELTADVQHVLEAGGRFGQDQFYNAGAVRAFQKAFREGKWVRGSLRAPMALAETVTKPILEWLVPRQKLGVMLDLAESELERIGPDATPAERRYALARAQDSVDNRLGQLIYDNNFWNRTAKDLAMLSLRSVGWNLGTIREVGGAAFDLATIGKRLGKKGGLRDAALTHRMAYTLALPIVTGFYGALYQKLSTGKDPEEPKDYFFPKTGKTNVDGSPERIALPSYMKDLYAYSEHPLTVAQHKLNPAVTTAIEMMQNKDYWGTEIRDPEDEIPQQALQLAEHAAKSFIPFSVQGAQRMKEAGEPLAKRAQSFVGLVPAPSYITRSPAQKLMAEAAAERRLGGPRDRGTAERAQTSREIETMIRRGDLDGARKAGKKALESGKITAYDLGKMENRLDLSLNQVHFKPLPLESKIKIWNVATPAERDELRDLMAKTLVNADGPNGAFEHMNQDELERVTGKLRDLVKKDPKLLDALKEAD